MDTATSASLADGLTAHGYLSWKGLRIATHLPGGSERSQTDLEDPITPEIIGSAILKHLREFPDVEVDHNIKYDLPHEYWSYPFTIKTEHGKIRLRVLRYQMDESGPSVQFIEKSVSASSDAATIGRCAEDFCTEYTNAIEDDRHTKHPGSPRV